MKPQITAIADLDRVIHEPGRLMIVALLFAVDRADFLYLQHETGMNKGTLFSHLSRLEEAGYIAVTKTYRGKVLQTLLCLTGTARPLSSIGENSKKRCSWVLGDRPGRHAMRLQVALISPLGTSELSMPAVCLVLAGPGEANHLGGFSLVLSVPWN